MVELSLIIPAHNEARRISESLKHYLKFISDKDEIIVVCNGCSDNSFEIVKEFTKKNNNLKTIDIKERIGKGAAVIKGFKIANGKFLGFMDADNAFDLNYIKKMINELKRDDIDVIIASKWKGSSFFKVSENYIRKILAIGWNLLVRSLLGMNFKDTQAGAKFMKRKAFEDIDHNFICRGFDFDVELLFKLKEKGFKIKEVYVPSKKEKFSTFHLRYIPRMFFDLVKLSRRRFNL